MKSKQLANVLIKVLGLSMCLHGIPSFATGFVRGFLIGIGSLSESAKAQYPASPYIIGSLVELALGIILIVKSKAVADFLFKGEDE